MQALIDVILPVFLVIGFGYLAAWKGWFPQTGVDGLMRFTQNFAIPCLLFRAISTVDLSAGLNLAMLASFYAGALGGFLVGLFGARFLFARPWPDAVAIGFIALFSNTVLIGLPIMERAYGPDSLALNYTIIALHAPFCYGIGITAMEIARNSGGGVLASVPRILRAMFRNALVIGIVLGFAANLGGIPTPQVVGDALDLMIRAAIPAALFGLGGVLVQYRPEGDMRTILFICAVSLLMHPAITWGLGRMWGLDTGAMRSAVLTAAMAPGVNAYVFANMYGVARRVAASAVLIATGATMLTAWGWITLLP